MTAEELMNNLGTLAKSGTSEFLAKAESDTTGNGNLIGAFGLGFYSRYVGAFFLPQDIHTDNHPVSLLQIAYR